MCEEHQQSQSQDSNRRQFLQTAATGVALTSFGQWVLAGQEDTGTGVPQRPLGKTGEKVSIVCLGGWHIGAIDENLAIRIMHSAIDEGMTFFDNAWDYHDGGSEEVMGKGLAEGNRRDKVFLMTKNCARDKKGSMKHLEDSLRRLKTDHLDLWQFHEINYDNDPDWIFEQEAIEAAIEAKKQGKVRYIGFTGHKHPDIHMKMIEKPYPWDTVQMPINIMDAQYRSFQNQVLPECNKRGIGAIGMKALGGGFPKGNIPSQTKISAETCRQWALSQPISSLVCGIASMEDLKQDLAVARGFKPIPTEEQKKLLEETRRVASDGRFELFKSGIQFDGPYHRKQHGFEVETG